MVLDFAKILCNLQANKFPKLAFYRSSDKRPDVTA